MQTMLLGLYLDIVPKLLHVDNEKISTAFIQTNGFIRAFFQT